MNINSVFCLLPSLVRLVLVGLSFAWTMTLPSACRTLGLSTEQSEHAGKPEGESSDWNEPTSQMQLLSLSAEDYQGLSSKGAPLFWQPILMPLRSGIALADKTFALGFTGLYGNVDGRLPDNGQCLWLPHSSPTPVLNENLSVAPLPTEISLETGTAAQTKNTSGQMFLIHDRISRFVRAIGFFNDEGKASCLLPEGRWLVSTGFGEARVHKPFSVQSKHKTQITLRAHPRAKIIVRSGKDTGLQFGDLMRIGRLRSQQPVAQATGDLPDVPMTVQDDLIRPVLTPSENGGVREYLFTSLMIQRSEFTLLLEPGEYAIGLWRDGFIHRCMSRLVVRPDEQAILACEQNKGSSNSLNDSEIKQNPFEPSVQILNPSLKQYIFDGSFLPSRLLNQGSFRAWMHKNGVNRFLRAGRTFENNQQVQFILQPLLQSFSNDRLIRPDGPYIGDFRLTQKSATDESMGRSPFARLLFAQAGINVESIVSRIFRPAFAHSILMAGSSERGFLEGVVPLTFRTYLRFRENRNLRTEDAESFASNGAQLEWLEPSPGLSGTPLKIGPQQHIRVRLSVPPEDTTEFLTMFINGEQYKQWTIPSTPAKGSMRTLDIDEKILMTEDFTVGFASWGKNYLPEFMYGVRQLPALGISRSYCFDINENSVCDRN